MSKQNLASLYSTNNKMKRIIEFRCKSLSAECIKDAYNNKPIKSIGCQNTGQASNFGTAPNGCPCKGPRHTAYWTNSAFQSGCVVAYGGISRGSLANCDCSVASDATCQWNYKYKTNGGHTVTAIAQWDHAVWFKDCGLGDCCQWFQSYVPNNSSTNLTRMLPCGNAAHTPTAYPQFTAVCVN